MKNRCFKKNKSPIGKKHTDVIPTIWRVQIYQSHLTTIIGCPVRDVERLKVDAKFENKNQGDGGYIITNNNQIGRYSICIIIHNT